MRLQMSKMQAKAKTSPKCLNLDPTKVFTRSALTLSEMIYHARVADDAACKMVRGCLHWQDVKQMFKMLRGD